MPVPLLMPPPLKPVGQDDVGGADLAKLRRQYRDWEGAKESERKEQRLSRHYYHGDQVTAEDRNTLQKRRQPVIIFNRVNRKVDGVVGTLERLRQDPKAYPRTQNHEEGAEIATAALRYALDQCHWEDKEGEGVRNAGVEGIGIVELTLEQGDRGDGEVGLDLVDPDTWFYDPRSFRPDFSDARYMGVAKWLHADDAKAQFPEFVEEIDGLIATGSSMPTLTQEDREKVWVNVEKKHIFLVEHWYVEPAGWHQCFYCGDVKLGAGPSPFKDERKRSISKYIAFSAGVDHDGDRYGFVRNLKSPQDEINMRRSKALHQLNTRRMVAEKGAFANGTDLEKARAEAMRPDGVIEYAVGRKFEFEDGAKQAEWQGQMEMLAEAKAEIENFGPTLVEKGMEKSGRAIALLQQSGLAELGPFIRSYRGWKLRIYRAMWNAIQQYWTAERWIRVTDNEGLADFIQVNGLTIDPMTGQPVLENAIGSLDVDIILDEAPDSVTTMQDTFELLESLAAAGVPVPPQVVIEMSGLPGSMKKRLIGMLEEAQNQPPDPMQEQAKQIALEGEQAKTKKTRADTLGSVAKAMKDFASVGEMMSVGDMMAGQEPPGPGQTPVQGPGAPMPQPMPGPGMPGQGLM